MAVTLLVIPFYEPEFFADRIPVVHYVYLMLEFISILLCSVYFIKNRKKYYEDRWILIFLLCYQMYILLITLVNQGRVFDVLKASAGVLGIILMMVIFSKFNSEYLLRIFQVYFYIIVLVTLITTFLYPNGLYTLNNYEPGSSAQVNSIRYFVGHKNQVVPFLLTGYIASVLLWVKRRKWLDGVVAISYIGILITITLIIDSMTSFAACVCLLGVLVISSFKSVRRIIPEIWIICVIIIDMLLTIFRIQDKLAALVALLGRDVTFSNRTSIWDQAIDVILQAPVFGYGVELDVETKARFLQFTSCHNIFFTNAYYGGMIAIALLLLCIFMTCRKLRSCPGVSSAFLGMTLAVVLFIGIFESLGIGLSTIITPLMFAINVDKFKEAPDIAANHSLK